jgi:hypothetical protein
MGIGTDNEHCLIGTLDSSYRMPPAFPRLIPAVGSSCESPNASLYTAVCFRALFRLPLTIAGAVDGGRSSSSEHTVGPRASVVCSSLSIAFTVVITLRVVLSCFLNSRRRHPGFFTCSGISVGKSASLWACWATFITWALAWRMA